MNLPIRGKNSQAWFNPEADISQLQNKELSLGVFFPAQTFYSLMNERELSGRIAV